MSDFDNYYAIVEGHKEFDAHLGRPFYAPVLRDILSSRAEWQVGGIQRNIMLSSALQRLHRNMN